MRLLRLLQLSPPFTYTVTTLASGGRNWFPVSFQQGGQASRSFHQGSQAAEEFQQGSQAARSFGHGSQRECN
jgi:hypothetical protein